MSSRLRFLATTVLCLVAATLPSFIHATESTSAVTRWSDLDEALRLRILRAQSEGGSEAAFKLVQAQFAKNPTPNVKALYASMLLYPGDWKAPEGKSEEGLALAQAALAEGSPIACRVMAWEYLNAKHVKSNKPEALRLLKQAEEAGDAAATTLRGYSMMRGLFGLQNPKIAEQRLRPAWIHGEPGPLFVLAQAIEEGKFPSGADQAKACELYYLTAKKRVTPARERLAVLAAEGSPEAKKYLSMLTLWWAHIGNNKRHKEATEALDFLRKNYPNDPAVLVLIGQLYRSGESQYYDARQALVYFDKAIALGSDDARCERAWLLANGAGIKKDTVAALAEWRALETKKHPGALYALGYFQYHGTLKGTDLKKNPSIAFAYAKRAADGGSWEGAAMTAECYADGVGVERNYTWAAHYYLATGGSNYFFKFFQTLDHAVR